MLEKVGHVWKCLEQLGHDWKRWKRVDLCRNAWKSVNFIGDVWRGLKPVGECLENWTCSASLECCLFGGKSKQFCKHMQKCWNVLNMFGNVWPDWKCLEQHTQCTRLGMSGTGLSCLEMHWTVWTCLEQSGNVWNNLDEFGKEVWSQTYVEQRYGHVTCVEKP